MKAMMDKETFQRLVLLYLLGQFPRGVFSSYRLQKVLYFATRDTEPKPFTFLHTVYGQYSRDATALLTEMLEDDLLKREPLKEELSGALWYRGDDIDPEFMDEAMEKGFPTLAESIRNSVAHYGFLKQSELTDKAHEDQALNRVPRGDILIAEVNTEVVEVPLEDNLVEGLEFTLCPGTLHLVKRAQGEAKIAEYPERAPF